MRNQKELITVRIWPDNKDWMDQYLLKGERSDFIRNAIADAISNLETRRVQMAGPEGTPQNRRTFVKEYLENPL